MTLRIRDRGKGKFKKLRILLKGGYALDIGINKKDGGQIHPSRDSITVAQVGAIAELGLLPNVPKRSFLRDWFDQDFGSIMSQVRAAGRLSFRRRIPLHRAAEALGRQFVKQVQSRMQAGIPPPNAPATIDRKGFDRPLIDTELLHDSISHEVKRVRSR